MHSNDCLPVSSLLSQWNKGLVLIDVILRGVIIRRAPNSGGIRTLVYSDVVDIHCRREYQVIQVNGLESSPTSIRGLAWMKRVM